MTALREPKVGHTLAAVLSVVIPVDTGRALGFASNHSPLWGRPEQVSVAMGITKKDLDQAFAHHKDTLGGSKEQYFALLYLMREFGKTVEHLAHHVAFGDENTFGLSAFHVDVNRRNLYLFQLQWSQQHQTFREPLRKLAQDGMDHIFGSQTEPAGRLLSELRSRLHEDQAVIDRVLVHLVFNGSPEDADQSAALDALREDLESKKYLVDRYFGRDVDLAFNIISNETRARAGSPTRTTHRYDIAMPACITSTTEEDTQLHVGFVALLDLYKMHQEMGQRLFERNIRAGLDPDGSVNKKIRDALNEIAVGKAPAASFVFNHNGVTIAAQELAIEGQRAKLAEPRVLNGAQTITSTARFLQSLGTDGESREQLDRLAGVHVLAKIVSQASEPFITAVTINTNRQNPVDPANLRASDRMQLELQDKFRSELDGIFYERQERAFDSISEEDLADQGFDQSQTQAIEIKRLARTLLAAQGEVDRMSRLNDMFEIESQYRACFSDRYLQSDSRRILLAYKVQFRLNAVVRAIEEQGESYAFVRRAKNAVWALLIQGVLNHPRLAVFIEKFGATLTRESELKEELLAIGSAKIRLILRDAVQEPKYREQLLAEKYSFFRTKAFYLHAMEIASERYGWSRERL